MPYTIPSYAVYPGSAYQPPGGVPGVVKANARALYLTRPGAYSSTRLLDQSPINSGTRRTGQEGRCYHFDGTDDYVTGGDISLTVKTVAFRIEPIDGVTSGTAYVIDLNGTDYIEIAAQGATGLVRTQGYSGATVTRYINGVPATTVALGSFQSVVVVSDVGFSASDFEIGRLAAACSEFKIFDVRLSSESLTAGQVTSYHTFGESGDAVTWDLWLKCDEQDGITSYDSSGNGRDTTITNATLATFHATQDIYSFQNQVGFNTSGAVYIPRDESDPTNDVLGNPLTYIGRRPNDADLNDSNCLTADGTLYIAAAHLAGTETVVSSGGTSMPSISAGRIDFTAGTCWDLTLSDGTHYKLAEGYGTAILDASGNGNHGILTSAVLANAWGESQNVYHSNLLHGCGKRMWFDGVDDYVAVSGMVASSSYFGACTISFTAFIENPTVILQVFHALGGAAYRLYSVSGFWRIAGGAITGVAVNGGLNRITTRWNSDGEALELIINGVSAWTGTAAAGSAGSAVFGVGARGDNLFPITGSIYDFSLTGSAVKNFSFNGYGNTDADWLDTTGNGNDGTVVGSPEPYYIPASTSALDAFGQPLTDPSIDGFRNRAETEFDYNPDSTPEMGADQLGITVPAAHAFGDAFAASTQIFARQRTATEDRNIVMTEAQTGAALTAIQNYTAP